jgi:hypothetical protein
MSGKGPTSLKELRSLREAVLAEEKAKAQAIIQTLPPSESELRIAEAALANAPMELEELTENSTSSTIIPLEKPMPSAPTAPAPQIRATPGVSRPLGAPVASPPARPKLGTKDPALIVPLMPKIQERLQRNVENSRWSPADLVIELIRANLHRGYPVIQYGDQVLARGGCYRTLERNPFETLLKLVSGQGVFNILVKPENTEFQHWLAHFGAQNVEDPERSAAQICLFGLQSYLENIEDYQADGWTKHISTDAYDLTNLTGS